MRDPRLHLPVRSVDGVRSARPGRFAARHMRARVRTRSGRTGAAAGQDLIRAPRSRVAQGHGPSWCVVGDPCMAWGSVVPGEATRTRPSFSLTQREHFPSQVDSKIPAAHTTQPTETRKTVTTGTRTGNSLPLPSNRRTKLPRETGCRHTPGTKRRAEKRKRKRRHMAGATRSSAEKRGERSHASGLISPPPFVTWTRTTPYSFRRPPFSHSVPPTFADGTASATLRSQTGGVTWKRTHVPSAQLA